MTSTAISSTSLALGAAIALVFFQVGYQLRSGHVLAHSQLSCFLLGCLFGALLSPLMRWCFKILSRQTATSSQETETSGSIYGLDHAILNVELPPKSMWMNMGYWKHASSFPDACKALLEEVLKAAGLLNPEGSCITPPKSKKFRLIDLGFGCGDQTLYLTRELRHGECPSTKVITANGPSTPRSQYARRSLLDSYVGITLVPSQNTFALQRLSASLPGHQTPTTHLFCADAANPASWSSTLQALFSPSPASPSTAQETHLLALDTLYHFRPSRLPILTHSCSCLRASLAAFDLLVSPSASLPSLLLLRLICLLTSTPYANFLTPDQYLDMLVRAGYPSTGITLRDVSEHVFEGLESHIRSQGSRARKFGLGAAMARFQVAGQIFGWWGRSGVVRGYVVVARHPDYLESDGAGG